jgi:hypothetical protein
LGPSGRIPIGAQVSSTLTPTDSSRTYSFGVTKDSVYSLFITVLFGSIQVTIGDTAGHVFVGRFLGPASGPLQNDPIVQFSPPATATWVLHIRRQPPGDSARFQLRVFEANPAPEGVDSLVAIGDTVSNETIAPIGDVDVFTAQVDSGQEVVAVAEAPTVTGLGALGLTVSDESRRQVGWAFFPTGVPARVTTGRMRAASTGAYRFGLSSIVETINGVQLPLFHGPYRFRTYAINPAPEHRRAGIQLGTVVTDESIDRSGDVDGFTFSGTAGAEVNVFYQAAVDSHVEIGVAGGTQLGSVASAADTGLYANFTGRLTLPQTGTYAVRVIGDGASVADTGRYRVMVYPIDRRPERVASTIGPGDTVVGEAIDLPGDIDEFTLSAAGGRDYYAFLQAENGSRDNWLQLDVVDTSGAVLGSVTSRGADTSLTTQMSGRIRVATSRTFRLRVSGAQPAGTGAYRFLVYQVNPKPESRPDTLALGDSVSGESVEFPGDVDAFRVHVPDSTAANLVWQGSIDVTLTDSATDGTITGLNEGYARPNSTGMLRLARGTYLVHVAGRTGPYRLWLFRFGLGPETARDTIVIGDTIESEAIDAAGDHDAFHFYGTVGQHINIMVQSLIDASGAWGVSGVLTGPGSGPPFPLLEVFAQTPGGALSDHQVVRWDLTSTGWYTLTMSGPYGDAPMSAVGPYRFAVVPVGTAPEVVGATLAIGDSVTAEPLSPAGDWDQFTVSGAPGSELNVLFGSSVPCCSNPYPYVSILDPVTGTTLGGNVGQGFRIAGPVKFPPSGQLAIAAYEPCGAYRYTGSYILQPLLLNRAPEVAPATYRLGDTVSSEAVSPAGDIDEFTMTAAPGDTLSAWWRLRADPVPAGSMIPLEVFDAASGARLLGGMELLASQPQFVSQGTFVVPASGRLLIRVQGTLSLWDTPGTGPYAFFVKRGG